MSTQEVIGAAIAARGSLAGRFSQWIGARQQLLSDHVREAGDTKARRNGWVITESTGRFGLGARTYRDPRFGRP